jgi:hypothetical protein
MFVMSASMKIGTMKNYRKEVNQMNSFDKQALDHWITREQPDDDEGPYDHAPDPQQAEIEHLKNSLACATQDAVELENDLAAARADLTTLAHCANARGSGPDLVARLAHIELTQGFCYSDDCRNATSIRILARIWKEGRRKEGQQ